MVDDGKSFVIHLNGHRKHCFISSERDKIVKLIRDNMEKYLQQKLIISSVANLDTLFTEKEIKAGEVFRVVVKKEKSDISLKEEEEEEKKEKIDRITKILVFTATRGIYEIDPQTNLILSHHEYSDIHSLVRSREDNKFIIEYNNDKDYCYICESGRDDILSTLLELCERNKLLVCLKHTSSTPKIGPRGKYNTVVTVALVKSLVGITKSLPSEKWLPIISYFNENFGLNSCSTTIGLKDKPLTILIQLLKELVMEANQKKMQLSQQMEDLFCSVLLALQRVLTIRECNEQVCNLGDEISILFQIMKYDSPLISFLASRALRFAIDQVFIHPKDKSETLNKQSLLTENNISILFDQIIHTRVTELKKYTLLLYTVTSLLELTVFSGISTTDNKTVKSIFKKLPYYFEHFFIIFKGSKSLGLVFTSSVLLRVTLQCIPKQQLEEIQTRCLNGGYLIQQIYICTLFTDPFFTISSGDVLGYLVEGNERAKSVLERTFPRPLLNLLKKSKNSKDQIEHLNRKICFSQDKKIASILPESNLQLNWHSMALGYTFELILII